MGTLAHRGGRRWYQAESIGFNALLRSTPIRPSASSYSLRETPSTMLPRVSPNFTRRIHLVNGNAALRFNRKFRFRTLCSLDVAF